MASFIRRITQRGDHGSQTEPADDRDLVSERESWDTVIKRPIGRQSEIPKLLEAVRGVLSGGDMDDRKMLLEHLIVNISRTPTDSGASLNVQQFLISLLYRDLPHPPSGYVGLPRVRTAAPPPEAPRRKYAFRSPDGSNYSQASPTMGMAGSAYAQYVPSTNNSPKTALPDPGLVFDTLLKRDRFVSHPSGISSMFFAFANLISHTVFNTDYVNPHINKASSYLDLSILYGSSQNDINSVRRKDGTGQLWDDVFADSRLLVMPPASCALLVLFCRNHNFIAQRLLNINESGTYITNLNAPQTMLQRFRQDEEIFNRARLVNCGYFTNILLGDYVGTILGLVRDQCSWRLNPLITMRDSDHAFTPIGEGNVSSIEFNLLYRWHSTLSKEDERWFDANTSKGCGRKPEEASLTPKEFEDIARKMMREQSSNPPRTWTFDGLKRQGPDNMGPFADADLARILQNATNSRARAFGARGVPEALRVAELMAIEQSRKWGTCSLNEFRSFLGLMPYNSFAEWNPDPQVHNAAASLYRDIDSLELYVGLQAEDTKPVIPGNGLCSGYTISRALLANVICLIRGDRFMTVGLTPRNLTAWGYRDCQFDTEDGSFGGLLTRLLFRALPDHYPQRSTYAHFPFMQPEFVRAMFGGDRVDQLLKYDWTRPHARPEVISVGTFATVKRILENPGVYTPLFESKLFTVVQPFFVLRSASVPSSRIKSAATGKSKNDMEAANANDDGFNFATRTNELSRAIFSRSSEIGRAFNKERVLSLINFKSIAHIGRANIYYVDIIRDVIALLPIHWISEVTGLPLKTNVNLHGIWSEYAISEKFANISEYIYLDFDPVNDWRLREGSQDSVRECIEIIKGNIENIRKNSSPHPVVKKLWEEHGLRRGCTPSEFSSQLFAAVVPTATLYSQALSNVIDFYLEDDMQDVRENIARMAKSGEDKSADIMVYVYEALRLRPITAGFYFTATQDDSTVGIRTGEIAYTNLIEANINHDSVLVGLDHGFFIPAFFEATIPAVLGAIFSLKDLKRGPGNSGKLSSFREESRGVKKVLYPSQRGLVSPWAESLILQST
ncbi:hypothetical protein HYPSUDRAFT_64946 [Hypholoma sublateritium FD-334 SS-4]|uniref:Heme peroxidase n=1 Tax=Hypholoma sublateritium (strain FD-334 SS-4) TaxID=945553 RepID=A0A0D2Q1F6_HYPSF|nr:hypothetical protein HYPSUDRAFT_64946 [Hypholoma sublateritium FD-334 SS-4]